MLQHPATVVQPSNRRWFVSSRRESDVTGYRSDHWRRVWERCQMVADVTLYPPSRQLDRRCRDPLCT